MKIASKSDVGMVRASNQDSFAAGELHGLAWAVVCDGMGGANGGNVASAIAVKTISDCISGAIHPHMKRGSVTAMLESAIVAANLKIYDRAAETRELSGMGTTVVACVTSNSGAIFAHAGDSRAYKIGGGITQMTRDHSVVQNMVEKGEITTAEARTDPRKHVITRALGVRENIEIEFTETALSPGDVILLCSDGLSNYVDAEKIYDIIENNEIENCPSLLIGEANRAGGADNITVVLIKPD